MSEPVRLNKLIAERTGCSRRKADQLIADGFVLIGNRRAVLGEQISIKDIGLVKVNNQLLPVAENVISFALYKPRGYVTTLKLGRETGLPLTDLLPPITGLKPAGRLDTDSEGLLIISNDGDLIFEITHPKHELEKEYLVSTAQSITTSDLLQLRKGVELEDGFCKPDLVKQVSTKCVALVIHEGRKREVRRLLAAVGHRVVRLIRVRIGSVVLDKLKAGSIRVLTPSEISSLRIQNIK